MTFWEHIHELRRSNRIPFHWNIEHLMKHLHSIYRDGRFRETTIRTVPWNQSESRDGSIRGDYVKKGRQAKAFRVDEGLFELIDDPRRTG
jgi:hypothetical protein